MASYGDVTHVQGRRADDITKKYWITLRDAFLIAIGAAGMWGTQVATQNKTQASIEALTAEVRSSHADMQRQIDEIRRRAEQGVVYGVEAEKEAARLEGLLVGSGVKGTVK